MVIRSLSCGGWEFRNVIDRDSRAGMQISKVSQSVLHTPQVDGEVWASMYDPLMERLRNDPRWQVRELPSNHLAPIAAPSLVAKILLEII